MKRSAEFDLRQNCKTSEDRQHDSEEGGLSNRNTRESDNEHSQNRCVCTYSADVSNKWVINVEYLGVNYPENLVLAQVGTSLTGSIELVGGGSPWTITAGSVTSNMFEFSGFFNSVPSLTAHFTGVIASNGSVSGLWNDVTGGVRTGTWASTHGTAAQTVVGCEGKGEFHYSDVNGQHYEAKVSLVNIVGNDVWFAGLVTKGNVGVGNWVFVKAHDGGTPGNNGDLIWGSFTTESVAEIGVANMSTPGDGPFAITRGNLVVH